MAIETQKRVVPAFLDPNEPPITSDNPNLTYRLEWADCPVCGRQGMVGQSLRYFFEKLGGHSSYCYFLQCSDLIDCEEERDRLCLAIDR